MSMVRFATVCDGPGCGERSAEYQAFPSCKVCGGDFCPECAEGDFYDEERNQTLCKVCYATELAGNEE
jgi:hypothetical protein